MKKTILFLLLMFFTGCSVKYYSPHPVPLAINDKNNTATASLGIPIQFEYQKKLNKKFDIILSVASSSGHKTENHIKTNMSCTTYFGGLKYWLNNRNKSGFGLGLFCGPCYMQNKEGSFAWNQFGVEFGFMPGYYDKNLIFCLPYRIGYGKTDPYDGEYDHRSLGLQIISKHKNIAFGLKVDGIDGGGNFSQPQGSHYDLVAVPVTSGLFLSIFF